MTRWIDPAPVDAPQALRASVGGHRLLAEALVRRGCGDPMQALRFLEPDRYRPADPSDLPGLSAAVERVRLAVRRRERIAVWGDFDADGQTATALLLETLQSIGADVVGRVPARERGHGILPSDVDALAADGARLLLTCDTGITEHAAVRHAQAHGMDVVVTDHHVPADPLPAETVVVNPHLLPSGHPMSTLSGVAVAYQLARSLDPEVAERGLDLVAIGLIADVSTLLGDARYLAQLGLRRLRESRRPGLLEMLVAADISTSGITEEHVAFAIAPRLNATGRLADASLGIELLTTADRSRARILAAEVEGLNSRRQWLTRQIWEAALAAVDRQPSLATDYSAVVLSSPSWPAGIIGIVAGRLAEHFGKPAVLIAAPPGGLGAGSARSVPGVDLVAALGRCAHLLARYGGHAGAAGFSLQPDRVAELRAALSRAVDAQVGAVPERTVQVDAYVGLSDLTLDLVNSIGRLAPFGRGNPPLVLAVRDLRTRSQAPIGRTGEHLRLTVEDAAGDARQVFWWQGAGRPLPRGLFDLAFTVRASDYRGETGVQIEWLDARSSAPQETPGPAPARLKVHDLRRVHDPAAALLRACGEQPLQVWAEGRSLDSLPDGLQGCGHVVVCGRNQLARHARLAVWSLPPGPEELHTALNRVCPEAVLVFSVDPGHGTLRPFLERLAGLCKFALRQRSGLVDLDAAAAAVAHRTEAVRAGIDLLCAQGKLLVMEKRAGVWQVAPGTGHADIARAQESAALLGALLEETAGYRDYLRNVPERTLAASLEEAAR